MRELMIMLPIKKKPLIMGILNLTPDSFSDGGIYTQIDNAVAQAMTMVEEGADIIDVGGESTRPGSDPVPAAEQIKRTKPIIKLLSQALPATIQISIDTCLSSVAEAALEEGASIINDISAGRQDSKMFSLVATSRVPYVLMHMQGTPKSMQVNPCYDDVINEVRHFFMERIKLAEIAGIEQAQIILDPGIGFGKRKQDNLQLIANLDQLVTMGFPVLLGTSRKRFMGSVCEVSDPQQLVTATAVTTALGVLAGVQLFRVHDVKENRQAMDLAWALKNA